MRVRAANAMEIQDVQWGEYPVRLCVLHIVIALV
jgi:hypothetical protein